MFEGTWSHGFNRATILMTKPIKIELKFESSQITEDLYGC
jgi:hypothetical protein